METNEVLASAGPKGDGRRWDRARWAVWGGLVLVLAALGISVLVGLARAEEAARRCSCFSNVRFIGLALVQYRDDHAGAYPQSLVALLRGGYLPYLRFHQCPSGGRRLPEGLPKDFTSADIESLDRLEADWSYVLTKGIGRTDDPDLILVYDRPENHRGAGRNCFFSDGHAQWLTEAEFRARMAEQEKLHNMGREKLE